MYLRRRGFAEAVPVVRVCIAFFFILYILFLILLQSFVILIILQYITL